MAELPSDDENELNFSDYEDEDDDDAPRAPTTSVIAHKEMKLVQISDAEEESDKEESDHEDSDKEETTTQELEFESISPPAEHSDDDDDDVKNKNNDNEQKISSTVHSNHESEEQTFEPISPVSDHGNFETISPPASPPPPQTSSDIKPQFENISDDEEEEIIKKPEEIPEGKFSPVQESDNELNFNVDENSNDSGYHIIPKPIVEKSEKTEDKTEEEGELPDEAEIPDEPEGIEEIEAPMPSPFSDIGDLDDITESDGQIISDILKDTDATEQQFEFKNEMFSGKTAPSQQTVSEEGPAKSSEEKDASKGEEESRSEETKEVAGEAVADDTSKKDKGDTEEDKDQPKAISEKVDDAEEEPKDKVAEEVAQENDKSGEKKDEDEGDKGGEAMDVEDQGSEKEEETNKEVEKPVEESTVADEGEGKKNEEGEEGKVVDAEKEKDEEKKDDEEDEGEDAGDLIADIFGDSDEEEEFEGFADEEMPEGGDDKESDDDDEVQPVKKAAPAPVEEEKKDDSSDDEPRMPTRDFVNDFDLMLEKKKAEKRIKRRRKDVDIISDNDEIIANMITKMKEAAEEDRMLNQSGKAATKKLKMLQHVIKSLRKTDLQMTFIDCGVLGGIKEWLTPLPDHALPHIHIRKLLLQVLSEFPPLEKSTLKSSGIGRAVMLLFKHPKETRENKYMAGKIISNWARPIFNVSTNFMDMSKEEREERDKRLLLQNKKKEERSEEPSEPKRNRLDKDDDEMENRPRRPGDPGWCVRARVPQASNRDYVNRPVSKVDAFEQTRSLNTKKPLNRYEKHALKMKNKKAAKAKAMDISLSGSKMGL